MEKTGGSRFTGPGHSLAPCLRMSLRRRSFIAVLIIMTLTIILTYALYGDWSNRNPFSIHQDASTSMGQNKSDDSRMHRGGNWQTGIADDNIQTDWKWERPMKTTDRERASEESTGNQEDQKDGQNEEDRDQALKVINLLSEGPKNHSMLSETIDSQLLLSYVKFLRDAMISHSSLLTQPTVRPSCVGNVNSGEVEDILCIPKPNYLKQVKNPCWHEASLNSSTQDVLHCLPYFHVLGCAKSATTDLWLRLMAHPQIIGNRGILHKSCLWWSWHRYGLSGYNRMLPEKFSDYVNCFSNFAQQMASSLDHGLDDHSRLVTGDGTPLDFWDFRGWPNITQNRGLQMPRVLTPHLMQHFYDNPKFIIIFREPIERLYSDYFFLGNGLTSQDFHNDIIRSIVILADCVKQHNFKACLYSHKLYHKMPVRFSFACYSVFMHEWLQVFPLKHFHFIKTEEYEATTVETLNTAFKFLNLDPLNETQMQEILKAKRARVTEQKKIAGPMKASTRKILTKLLQPCGHLLARMIQQPQFVWDL